MEIIFLCLIFLEADEGNTFFVTIQRLTQEDAGTYWCGIDRVGADTFIQVVLSVVKGDSPACAQYFTTLSMFCLSFAFSPQEERN
uniref:Immunoglobulin V-set domain-containing protein n=1 Tax=Echeneis naucrates TaxID=173247 RepID=A0A665WAZ1_ECHNA